MKGLLLKDIYTLVKQFKIILAAIIIFSVLPGYSMSAFAMIYSAFLPITALAYDERSKWNKLAKMMPYSNKSIVFSKYVLGYLCLLGAFIISLVGKLVYAIYKNTPISTESLLELIFLLCVAILLQSLNLPFMFKVGVEKGRLIFAVITVAVVVGVMTGSNRLVDVVNEIKISQTTLFAFILGITIVINVISIFGSIKFYEKREV